MSDKPIAEILIDEVLVRGLLRAQLPKLAPLPLSKASEGWDCEVWRLGTDLAVRLPRRALSASLTAHEQFALPLIAPAVEATGVRLPAPLFHGAPGAGYPWAWSMVPWIDGDSGLSVRREDRTGWARPLARALRALHAPAPADYPVNPARGAPLAARAEAVAGRLDDLRRQHGPDAALDALEGLWDAGVAAPTWQHPPVWVHGDLHPGNLLAHGSELCAIIDFGDVTGGDPAYDLAVAWLAFDDTGRHAFIDAFDGTHDAATWVRARAWAGAVALMLLAHSDDNPAYAALGAEALDAVVSGGRRD